MNLEEVIELFEIWLLSSQPNINMNKKMDDGFPVYEHPLVCALFGAFYEGARKASERFSYFDRE